MNIISKYILWHHLQLWNYMNHTDHRHIWRPVKTDLTILKCTDDKEAYKTPQLLARDQWGFITSDHMADVLKIRLTTLQLRIRPAELLLDGACKRSNNNQQLSDISTIPLNQTDDARLAFKTVGTTKTGIKTLTRLRNELHTLYHISRIFPGRLKYVSYKSFAM